MDVWVKLTLALVFLTGCLFAWYAGERRKRLPPPPGPPGLPLLGNVFGVPLKEAWLTYMEWAKRFSALNYHQPVGIDC